MIRLPRCARPPQRNTSYPAEMLQASKRAPQSLHATAHLLDGLTFECSTLRLRVHGDLSKCAFRLHHRSVPCSSSVVRPRHCSVEQGDPPSGTLTVLCLPTGGTDICSLFVGLNTTLPVYRGELQCRMLGMAVEAYTPAGARCEPGQPGELVCLKPFPCQPVGFWPLPGYGSEADVAGAKERYKQAYFSEFEGVWCECP